MRLLPVQQRWRGRFSTALVEFASPKRERMEQARLQEFICNRPASNLNPTCGDYLGHDNMRETALPTGSMLASMVDLGRRAECCLRTNTGGFGVPGRGWKLLH